MSEPVWYYALGEKENGPVSKDEICDLMASGQLGATDLVWRDGMPDWTAIDRIPDLKVTSVRPPPSVEPPPPPPHTEAPVSSPTIRAENPRRTSVRSSPRRPSGSQGESARLFARPLVLAGMFLVLLSRGCDAVGERYAARLEARASVTQQQFQDRWDRQRQAIQAQEDSIREQDVRTSEDNEKLVQLRERLDRLDKEMSEKRQTLEKGDWQDLKNSARDAVANNTLWAYWRALFFVFGAIVLTSGLFCGGYAGDGPERWVCLVMLAVITYSLFVGGSFW